MYGEGAAQHSDALLFPFLRADSEVESEPILTRLLDEQASPLIKTIIRSKLHTFATVDDRLQWQDDEDIYEEVVTSLIERLRTCKSGSASDAIQDFRSYVAVVTYNACHEYLRSKYPQRWRLKNRLRYLLTHQPDLSLWQNSDGEWLCGFATWSTDATIRPVGVGVLRQLIEDPQKLELTGGQSEIQRARLPKLLEAVFRKLDSPVELEALVSTVAELQGIKDLPFVTNSDSEPFAELRSLSQAKFATEMEDRSYLLSLWSEIVQLPLGQRAALLLNLRDLHDGVIMLLPLTGVATIRQIAEVVAIPIDEFAQLWNQLPLDDTAVAERLGVTRQQVINLRKSARARLSRRMRQRAAPRAG